MLMNYPNNKIIIILIIILLIIYFYIVQQNQYKLYNNIYEKSYIYQDYDNYIKYIKIKNMNKTILKNINTGIISGCVIGMVTNPTAYGIFINATRFGLIHGYTVIFKKYIL